MSLADSLSTWQGAGEDARAGDAVSYGGDVDGDGYPDVLVGSPRAAESWGASPGAGYVLLGPATAGGALSDTIVLWGQDDGDRTGRPIASAGDFDGDDIGDVILGASYSDLAATDAGAAFVVLGPITDDRSMDDADGRYLGASEDDKAGYWVTSPGDLDSDGLDDLLIGARDESTNGKDAGAVYVVMSPVTRELTLSDADGILYGSHSGDVAGHRVAGAGDLDQDGIPDLLVGARGTDEAGDEAGGVYVVLGPATGSGSVSLRSAGKLVGIDDNDHAGPAAGAGDIDGDGWNDVLVGAAGVEGGGGTAYIVCGPFSGHVSLADADAMLPGEATGDAAGTSVAGGGDFDGDGWPDIVVGAVNAGGTGAAYVLRGGGW